MRALHGEHTAATPPVLAYARLRAQHSVHLSALMLLAAERPHFRLWLRAAEGVHKSEVVVLLASEGVLTRPWCLLEVSATRARPRIRSCRMPHAASWRHRAAPRLTAPRLAAPPLPFVRTPCSWPRQERRCALPCCSCLLVRVCFLCVSTPRSRSTCAVWQLYEAGRLGIPVIPVSIEKVHGTKKRCFDLVAARHMLSNIETQIEIHNPGALADLQAHLAASGTSIHTLKRTIMAALKIDDAKQLHACPPKVLKWHRRARVTERTGRRHRLNWARAARMRACAQASDLLAWPPPTPSLSRSCRELRSGGTDAQVLADAKDLVSGMAEATGRTLHWTGEEDEETHFRRLCHWRWCGGCFRASSAEQYSVFIACEPEETVDVSAAIPPDCRR